MTPINPIITYFDAALTHGLEILRKATETGTRRLIRGEGSAFDLHTQNDLTNHFATILTVSNLIGQYKVHRLAIDNGYHSFAEGYGSTPWTPEDLMRLVKPIDAVEFFRRLMPVADTPLFDMLIAGQAFQIAASADQVITKKIHKVIQDRIETGKMVRAAGREINEILDESGITHPNNYGEMCVRTNVMESYRNGAWDRVQRPGMREAFPVWKYLGIADKRERLGPFPDKPDHHRHFNHFWPASISFFDVRGRDVRDVVNCRCDFAPIHKRDAAKLIASGITIENEIPPH